MSFIDNCLPMNYMAKVNIAIVRQSALEQLLYTAAGKDLSYFEDSYCSGDCSGD